MIAKPYDLKLSNGMNTTEPLYFFIRNIEKMFHVIDYNPGTIKKIFGENKRFKKIVHHCSASNESIVVENLIIELLKTINISPYLLDSNECLAYGRTENNKKQFRFLCDYLKGTFAEISVCNLEDYKQLEKNSPLLCSYYFDVESFSNEIKQALFPHLRQRLLTEEHILYILKYVQCYINFKVTFDSFDVNPLICVIANDHSPAPLAFKTVCEELSIPIIYLQHAQVTNSFPSLDYNLSLLFNEASKEIYLNKGKHEGLIEILPREIKKSGIAGINRFYKVKGKVDIVVCPSRIYNEKSLFEIISRLSKSEYVRNIYLKPHPVLVNDHKLIGLISSYNVQMISNLKESQRLVAIAGNSSVILDLLNFGIPVYYVSYLDDIKKDYYGFLSNGLVKEVHQEELEVEFWEKNPYVRDSSYFSIYNKYLPDQCYYGQKKLKAIIAGKVAKLIFEGKALSDSNIENVNKVSFNESSRGVVFNEKENVIDQANKLFDERNNLIISEVSKSNGKCCSDLYSIWLALKWAEWPGNYLKEVSLDVIHKHIDSYNNEILLQRKTKYKIINILLGYYIKIKDVGAACSLINENAIDVSSIKPKMLGGLINIFDDKRSTTIQEISHSVPIKKIIESSKYSYNSLRTLVLAPRFMPRLPHEWYEKKFIALNKGEAVDEYLQYVAPVYEKLRSQMQFMDVRFSSKQRNELYKLIKEKLKSRTPYGFLRLSDGEGYLFQESAFFLTQEDIKNRERHWWGGELPESLRKQIVIKAKASLQDIDLIGIPCIYRIIRDTGLNAPKLTSSLTTRGVLEVLRGVENLNARVNKYQFTEEKSNDFLFSNIGKINELCSFANKVIVISSKKPCILARFFDPGLVVHFITLPSHIRQSESDGYEYKGIPLPYCLDEVNYHIANVVESGDLVLVAGGVASKYIIAESKIMGAVALDIGSAIDNV